MIETCRFVLFTIHWHLISTNNRLEIHFNFNNTRKQTHTHTYRFYVTICKYYLLYKDHNIYRSKSEYTKNGAIFMQIVCIIFKVSMEHGFSLSTQKNMTFNVCWIPQFLNRTMNNWLTNIFFEISAWIFNQYKSINKSLY